MIPYIVIPDGHIGPITIPYFDVVINVPIHPFGVLVALGVMIGTTLANRRAERLGYDLIKLNSFITWMLVMGFICGHMLDEIFYHWDTLIERPISLFLLYEGLSSFGGFTGALIGIVMWKYLEWNGMWFRRRARPQPILAFADLIVAIFPVAWIFGRSGCSVVHDHPGALAAPGTWLAEQYPAAPGGALRAGETVTHFGFIDFVHGSTLRFDLGLLELLFTIVLAACFALTWHKRMMIGTYIVAAGLAYAPVRFAMDFLRITEGNSADPRYAGLTPAQWECIALFALSVFMFFYARGLKARGIDVSLAVRATPESQESVGKPSEAL